MIRVDVNLARHRVERWMSYSDHLSSVCLSINYSHFYLPHQNHSANVIQTGQNASLGEKAFKFCISGCIPSCKGEIIHNLFYIWITLYKNLILKSTSTRISNINVQVSLCSADSSFFKSMPWDHSTDSKFIYGKF